MLALSRQLLHTVSRRAGAATAAAAAACGCGHSHRDDHGHGHMEEAVTSSPAAPLEVAQPLKEHSFLRHLIPLRVQGAGSMASLLRHTFLQQSCLIPVFLGALEQVPLPALPRMLLAEGFQQMLDGCVPQRQLRELFEEADVECRKVLLDLDFDGRGKRGLHEPGGGASPAEEEAYRAVQTDPLRRLLMYELRGAAGYYARMMAVSSEPEVSAGVLLRTMIASDVRLDMLLGKVILAYESHPRDVVTGEPKDAMPGFVADLVKELLLVERDAFGVFRFDPRGDNRMLLHCVKLDNVVKTPETHAILLDPTVREHGCFTLEKEVVYEGRWMRYHLSCAEDDLRIVPTLPVLETVLAPDDLDPSNKVRLDVRYADPICRRHKAPTREEKSNVGHVETFELAIEKTNRTYWERFFMDR